MKTEFVAHYFGPDKKPQTVRRHLEEAYDLAGMFAGKIGLSSMGSLAGLLHDVGKYSEHFQAYIRSAEGQMDPDAVIVDTKGLKGKIDHSTAGAQLVWNALRDKAPISRLVAQTVALCVASHHSGLLDCLSPDGRDKFSARIEKTKEKTHLDEVWEKVDREVLLKIDEFLQREECEGDLRSQLERLFQGEESREVREFYVGLLVRYLFSALIDADRLSSAGRIDTNTGITEGGLQWPPLIDLLERYISGIEQRNWVDELRTEISLACLKFASRDKGLYKLTVPTGGGKTISSLRFGLHHAVRHGMERLVYVIPYTSIIDQNAAIARAILERTNVAGSVPVVLEHHSNLTPGKETWQSRLLAENWDARVIFTTTVQFLEALFSGGTRDVRRMHNLANAVIIFDEIQTLPVKTVHLFNNAVNFLVKQCGSTVVFCTATQPLLDAVDPRKGAARLAERPEMAPRPDYLFKALRRVDVLDERQIGGWTDEEVVQRICSEAKDAGSTLAIVNTKAAARALFDLCRARVGITFHLSTNMCPVHRMEIIGKIKDIMAVENHGPLVCVSTQLIEAGVDVDFGAVIRYMAGLDSVGQAAGRCNRNGRRLSGKVLIVNPSNESLDNLADIALGRDIAARVLEEYRQTPGSFDDDLLSPKAMERYYRYYFFKRAGEMAYRVTSKDIGHGDDLLSLLSVNPASINAYTRVNKSAPCVPLRQSFESAGRVFKVIDAPTEGVIVPYGERGREIIAELCAVADIKRARQLLREAQRYSVNLYAHELKRLSIYETKRGSGIFYLDERHYSTDLGVVLDSTGPLVFLNG